MKMNSKLRLLKNFP